MTDTPLIKSPPPFMPLGWRVYWTVVGVLSVVIVLGGIVYLVKGPLG